MSSQDDDFCSSYVITISTNPGNAGACPEPATSRWCCPWTKPHISKCQTSACVLCSQDASIEQLLGKVRGITKAPEAQMSKGSHAKIV